MAKLKVDNRLMRGSFHRLNEVEFWQVVCVLLLGVCAVISLRFLEVYMLLQACR